MIQQTPWVLRSFNFDFPVGIFPVIFSRLEGSIFRIYSLLGNAGEEADHHAGSGWSVKEHTGHLYDLEELWWKRLQDYRDHKAILTAADMNNTKTKEAGHNQKSLEELVDQFSKERQRMLEIIYGFDEEMLSRTAIHPRLNTPMRLVDCLYFVAEHDDHHISALSNLLRHPQG